VKDILDALAASLFGKDGSKTEGEIKNLSQREKFSDYLPYLYYDDTKKVFINTDNTYGYCYECAPVNFYMPKQKDRMKKLLELKLPARSVLTFHLLADKHIKPMLDAYVNAKTRKSVLSKRSAMEYANHLLNGVDRFDQTQIPIRNFISFISIKSPELLRDDQVTSIEEALKSVGIYRNKMNGNDLTVFLRRFLNGQENQYVSDTLSSSKPIRKQLIEPTTEISFPVNSACKIANKYAACLTQLSCPDTTSLLDENRIYGGFMGPIDDGNQLLSSFMSTLIITFDDVDSELDSKTSIMVGQSVVGKKATQLNSRISELLWVNRLTDTTKAKVQYTLWIFADSEERLKESVSRAKRLATDKDYVLQEETLLKPALFIASLPFGFYHIQGNVELIDRYTILPADSISAILPIQADYSGRYRLINGKMPEGQRPVSISIGRKGQIQAFDIFDEGSLNHNLLITAGSGAGKSFSLGKLINDYYAAGAKVRAVDIGYSLEKSCRMNKGRFIDLGSEKIVLNPFYYPSKGDKDDQDGNFNTTVNVLAEMVYSTSGKIMEETENTLLKKAARWAVNQGNIEKGIDAVQYYLNHFKELGKEDAVVEVQGVVDTAKIMAFNMSDFTSNGIYGRYFNGKSTFDISSDDFVILELQKLKEVKDLFSVMTMQVVNSVTQDLYLSNREDQRFVLFEEAAHYLKKQGHKDLVRLAEIIEEGYRRARKHNGSFGAVLQSILDLNYFGSVGKVLKSNAEYKFFLYSEDYREASDIGLIPHKGLALDLLESTKLNKPRYSEFMMESPQSFGSSRLAIDPWNYWVNTSEGKQVKRYNDLITAGLLPEQAIAQLAGIAL
jgi:conjugal transfer ATP-binding protein TraC